jgi:DNA polymerase-3 subunit delta
MADPPLVHLVKGEDPVLRSDVTARLVQELLAGEDRGFALDDLEIPSKKSDEVDRRPGTDQGDDDEAVDDGVDLSIVERIMVALSSPPFLTNRRVVVIRNYGALSKDQSTMVAERLTDPTPGVFVVLEHRGGRVGPIDTFAKQQKIGAVTPEAEKVGKNSKSTSIVEVELQRCLDASGVKLAKDARARVLGHLGDDAGRVAELVEILASRFTVGASVRADDVEPYLGAVGALDKPFELTSAIETGDTAKALDVLHRLMHATSAKSRDNKPIHPMQLMAVLSSSYRSMLKLDDPNVHTKDDAASVLGGNPWSAKHRLDALHRIGSDGLHDAFALLAQADLDLRGAGGTRAIDEETVMQLLVARLCALSRRGARGGRSNSPVPAGRRS